MCNASLIIPLDLFWIFPTPQDQKCTYFNCSFLLTSKEIPILVSSHNVIKSNPEWNRGK